MALATASSCGGGDGPTAPTVTAGVRAVAGMGLTDTIEAQPLQALIAEVRGPDGKPVQGTVVRFEAQPSPDTTKRGVAAISVCAISAPSCGQAGNTGVDQFASDTTDAQGRAKAVVRLGRVAGRAVIRLKVPVLAYEDSATFTVTAGAAARVRASSPDTIIEIGSSTVLRGQVVDRFGNARPELPVMTAGPGNAVTIDAATGAVSAKALGEQWVFLKVGSLADSTIVRAVPAGRLVVWSSLNRSVYLMDMNGANRRLLVTGVASDFGAFPRFDASRRNVTMHDGTSDYGGTPGFLVLVDTATSTRRDVTTASFTGIMATRYMADGSILVVSARQGSGVALWRVGADGSVTLKAALPNVSLSYGGADISADGARVAYTTPNGSYGNDISVVDVASGAAWPLVKNAHSPRWSPQGDRVAYLASASSYNYDGPPAVVNADGTGARTISGTTFYSGIAWSPDGAYLLGRSASYADWGLRVVRLSDGVSVLLRFRNVFGTGPLEEVYQPDWR